MENIATIGWVAQTGLPLPVSISAYNANNQLTTWGTANLGYDANGNMTSDGTHSYSWDARNQLSTMDFGSTASFNYDPFGRRTSKTIVGTQSGFLYDGANPVQEISGTTPTANLLSGGIDEIFQRTDSAGARSFLSDALGSTLALTDSTGTTQTSYTFDPFGNTTASGAASTNSFQYTGRENDGTGLYFYRARYYSPVLQRFISEDPVGFNGGSIDLYAFVANDPVDWTDPLGEDVTVRWLEGLNHNPSGHIVVAVNDEPFLGFENVEGTDFRALLNLTVPGIVEQPRGGPDRKVWDQVTIHTTPDMDRRMLDYIRQRVRKPGNYKLIGRNCTSFANDVLDAGVVEIPDSIKPKNFMQDIHQMCTKGLLSCAP